MLCKRSFLRRKRLLGFGKGVTGCKLICIFLSELIGTGILVYLGCMAVLHDVSHLRASLTFGLAAVTAIQSVTAVSGGHINPAVSVAAVVMGKITAPLCIFYIAAQTSGALLGYGLLLLVTPEEMRLKRTCCTLPADRVSILHAVSCEFAATSILIFLFCSCCDRRNDHKQDSTPIKFGMAITLLVAVIGPYTGGSLNPVRSLAPAIFHNSWTLHWIYSAGQMAASLVIPTFYRLLFSDRLIEDPIPDRSKVTSRTTLEQALREALTKRQLNRAQK